MKKKAVMVCLVNRCMRDPHVQWCESLSPSASAGGAGYLIKGWRFCLSLLVCPFGLSVAVTRKLFLILKVAMCD